MNLQTEKYLEQQKRWPTNGRHILAQYDGDSIVVYQAYKPATARYAVEHQKFGGEFSFNRMSWIKPNFLWMMYRSGWASKPGQEHVLTVRIKRMGFDQILSQAVHSAFVPEVYGTFEQWKSAVAESPVRLQWDPDHGPAGEKQERRAIQLGLSGEILRRYGYEWILGIEDITAFVHEQKHQINQGRYEGLVTPAEHVYPVENGPTAQKLGVGTWPP
jgi:hypothetical protein